ncbi:MAG: hypothetical protein ACI87A_001072, partial [Planctomycetota bacterium]
RSPWWKSDSDSQRALEGTREMACTHSIGNTIHPAGT